MYILSGYVILILARGSLRCSKRSLKEIKILIRPLKTGKKQLIIAGIVTDVCVAFAALSAVEAGYEVFVVTDASGTFNAEVRDAAWRRMEAAGVQLVNFFSVACELHRDWRNDMEGLAALLGKYIPAYQNIMTSFSAK